MYITVESLTAYISTESIVWIQQKKQCGKKVISISNKTDQHLRHKYIQVDYKTSQKLQSWACIH